MNNPPLFTVAPSKTPTQSLLQWAPGAPFELCSVEMDTEIAEHLAGLAARERKLTTTLTNLAYWSDRVNSLQHAHCPIKPSTWSELFRSTNEAKALVAE